MHLCSSNWQMSKISCTAYTLVMDMKTTHVLDVQFVWKIKSNIENNKFQLHSLDQQGFISIQCSPLRRCWGTCYVNEWSIYKGLGWVVIEAVWRGKTELRYEALNAGGKHTQNIKYLLFRVFVKASLLNWNWVSVIWYMQSIHKLQLKNVSIIFYCYRDKRLFDQCTTFEHWCSPTHKSYNSLCNLYNIWASVKMLYMLTL